mmetsp:Transcript_12625/g.23759  ORF Transcript_12625/g.23759 Transcript_12625/m.23759 type:complete len:365 (-) Transcript_12625:88-1182(-)
MTRLSAKARARLATLAVSLSFWLGGVSLVAIKCMAYFISGSELIKASVFESLGDVMSSAILAVTQMKVRDTSDMHLYPTGKKRFTPLGILFFSAFAVSTMISLIIENVEKLFGASEEEERRELLTRLFDEQPRLRQHLQPSQLEQMIESYVEEEAAAEAAPQSLVLLLFVCILIKMFLLVFCLYAARQADSEIARTVAMDHRNDILGNSLVLLIVAGSGWCRRTGHSPPWLDKVDPSSSMLLALYVLVSWLQTAAEQLRVLSDKRAEEEHTEAIVTFTQGRLANTGFSLTKASTYHIGEGYAVILDLTAQEGMKKSATEIAVFLEGLEQAVHSADLQAMEVHAKLRTLDKSNSADNMAWVAGYK